MRICGGVGHLSEKVNICLGESLGDDRQEIDAEGHELFLTRRKLSRSVMSLSAKAIPCSML
jgi:hypothetical protein